MYVFYIIIFETFFRLCHVVFVVNYFLNSLFIFLLILLEKNFIVLLPLAGCHLSTMSSCLGEAA